MTQLATPPPATTEAALVALIPGLTRAARALVPSQSDAEDLVQEALLQVWSQQSAGAEIEALPAYARATLRNATRRRGRLPATDALVETDWVHETAETGPRRVAFADVMQAIAGLSSEQRAVLTAVVIEGQDPQDVARSLGVARGTVLSRLARARAKLRALCELSDGAEASSLLPRQCNGDF
ncbi:MAG: RNA polymerase sigma factor [Pseudomonadota bacterium]